MVNPHSKDLRKGRISEPGRIYHIRTSSDSRRPLFTDFQLGREVVKAMRFLHERGDVEGLAFVVMPHHFHWLIDLTGPRPLARVMLSLKSYSAHRINALRGAEGPVWQEGYFDRAVRKEDDLRAIARYIVANPLGAGL